MSDEQMGYVFDRLEEIERRMAELRRSIHWQHVLLWGTLAVAGVALAIALWGHG